MEFETVMMVSSPHRLASHVALPGPMQVHQKTGESAEAIAERKRQAAWGAWLDVPFNPAAAAAAAAEEEAAEGEEEEGAEPAAAAACLQLQRQQGGTAAAAATLPEGAGGALLLHAALRWHTLASRFCAAVQVGRDGCVRGG